MNPFILFDDALHKNAILLQNFSHQDELSAKNLEKLDKILQKSWAKNLHCALLMDYELGLALQKLPERTDGFSGCLKILWFTEKIILSDTENWLTQQAKTQTAGIATPTFNTTKSDYLHDIAQIQAAIARGETYQINHTVRLHTQTYGDPIRLYARLRQNVPYAALACLPEQHWVLCFSPELFLRIESSGKISTEPMKGTAPILGDGLDEERAINLRHDPKNLAENTMIVDLLRNDLGKIAEIGGVSVPAPFQVNAFGHVWQMTSEVVAQLKQGITAADIIRATFPCGSITGAPKRKSMELIDILETSPRGLYTGSIGFLAPQPNSPLGFSGCLNVVIRSLFLSPKKNHFEYSGIYGVGSGIVMDSQAEEEYEECGWKARFLTDLRPEFGLFETMRVENQKIAWCDAHLARLAQSAQALNIPFSKNQANDLLHDLIQKTEKNALYRAKLTLTPSGSLKTECAPMTNLPPQQKIIFSETVLPNHDPLRRHKITQRTLYDATWQHAEQHGAFDALLFNEDGFLLEGGRSSIMILLNHQWLTPALDLDILPSIARQDAMCSGSLKEAYITREMVQQAEKIRVGNALRGWFDVLLG